MLNTAPGQSVEAEQHDGADEATYERLAKLGPVDYDRARKNEALALGCGAPALDKEVERRRPKHQANAPGEDSGMFQKFDPWPDHVDGAALLDGIAGIIERHMVLPPCAADAIALWVLHAHAHDTASISPLLAVTSPTPECGKSTLLILLGGLVPKPLTASNITAAALFRSIEKWSPTLLVDEADTFLRNSDDLRGIIDSGHNRGTAYVLRTEGDNHDPRRFVTWAPKVIALIGKLHATLANRAIHIELRRMGPGETVEPTRADRLDFLIPLHRQAARWAEDNRDRLAYIDPDLPATLRGRTADNWRHLFAIAETAGGDWLERAKSAAEALTAKDAGQTAAILLLKDMRDLFADAAHDGRIASKELAEILGGREDRPWSEWKNGKPITQRQIARLLEPFGVGPGTVRTSAGTPKGYRTEQFEKLFASYLTPFLAATPPQVPDTNGFSDSRSATLGVNVADRKVPKATDTNTCGGVADRNPEGWEEGL